MPMPAHMTVTGENQGAIDGSCDMTGREKTILVYSMAHDVHIPRDPQSGLASGKRIHGPLSIVKEYDKSSPKLYQALCTGEHMKEVKIKWYRIDPKGKEEHYFTHTLEDAIVVAMKPYMPMVFLKENEPYRHMEDVAFTYKKIKWTWEIDGIESEDSWAVPT
ncbi:MAG TPA: Hcp family type VI secretion system effector [Thermodesulfobacteriota bacterium]